MHTTWRQLRTFTGQSCSHLLITVDRNINIPISCVWHRLVRDPRAGYKQSLAVLEQAKKSVPGMVTKSSIMLGCGENDQQVLQTLRGKKRLYTF